MFGGEWASLIERVFRWVTDEQGLASFKQRRQIAALRKEITNAIACKNWQLAASKLDELKRLSDAV